MPKPHTIGQMLSFLGMTGYSRVWICDCAIQAAPLIALICAVGQTDNSVILKCTNVAE